MSVNICETGSKKRQAHNFITTGLKKRNKTSIDLTNKRFGFIAASSYCV